MFNYYPKEKVFSFEKPPHEEVQFALSERKGKAHVDIRVYHIQEDGSKIGTHKGIFVPVEKLADFKTGIERLIDRTEGETK